MEDETKWTPHLTQVVLSESEDGYVVSLLVRTADGVVYTVGNEHFSQPITGIGYQIVQGKPTLPFTPPSSPAANSDEVKPS